MMERFRLLHKWYGLGYINPDAATTETIGRKFARLCVPVLPGQATTAAIPLGAAWKFKGILRIMSTATMRGAMNAINAAATEEQAVACLKYLGCSTLAAPSGPASALRLHFNYVTWMA